MHPYQPISPTNRLTNEKKEMNNIYEQMNPTVLESGLT